MNILPRKVMLYGELGEKYGKEFTFYAGSIGEVFRLLSANFKDFRSHLLASSDRLEGYQVWDGDRTITESSNDFEMRGNGAIKIIPIVRGAGAKGVGGVMTAIGVVLAAYGAYSGDYSLVSTGAQIALGGISLLMIKDPYVETDPEVADLEETKSYIFNGAQNSMKAGAPIAIGYGQMVVGSNVIAAAISVKDIPV